MRNKSLFILLLFLYTASNAQHRILSLRCDSLYQQCDTILIEYYDANQLLIQKEKRSGEKTNIQYFYNTQQQVVLKKHFNSAGELQKENHIYYDSNGDWTTDSLLGKNAELLVCLQRTRIYSSPDSGNRYKVEWYYKGESTPFTTQLTSSDTAGRELTNSTCYSPVNCVTTVFSYGPRGKTATELWVLQPDSNVPQLTESEEYYYTELNQQAGMVRFMEPNHVCIERIRYKRLEGLK